MTLNDVIAALAEFPVDAIVYLDFCDLVPTRIAAWRGNYTEPSLGWREGAMPPTVGELLEELTGAIGSTFTGWKGGEYTYTGSEQLHVDNRGHSSRTEIVAVEADLRRVMIRTERRSFDDPR